MKSHIFLNQFCLLLVVLVGMGKPAMAQEPYQKQALGITFGEITKELQQEAKTQAGAVIVGVGEESAAQKAGVKPNDIITKVNDTTIESAAQLNGLLKPMLGGSSLVVTLLRNGKTLTRQMRLNAVPAPNPVPAPASLKDANGNIIDEDASDADDEKDNK